jgi:hypothetical protein
MEKDQSTNTSVYAFPTLFSLSCSLLIIFCHKEPIILFGPLFSHHSHHIHYSLSLSNLNCERLKDTTNTNSGKSLTPEEWLAQMRAPNAIIVDCRNYYESEIGMFND